MAGNAATPWSDWAAVEGNSRVEKHAGAAFAGYGTEAARVAGSSADEPETDTSAHSGVSGQWSPTELAAQAKAWADWAALQAQGSAQSSNQSYSYAFPEATAATEGAEAASGASGQGSPAELAAQAKAWADWAAWQAQSGAQAHSQDSCTYPAAAAAAQPGDAGTVSIPVSMYRRYQQLEWAEWRRQYEDWQKHMAEWQKQYVHWYSSYISWYSQSVSAAV